jgi:hypothetical protein
VFWPFDDSGITLQRSQSETEPRPALPDRRVLWIMSCAPGDFACAGSLEGAGQNLSGVRSVELQPSDFEGFRWVMLPNLFPKAAGSQPLPASDATRLGLRESRSLAPAEDLTFCSDELCSTQD